MSSIEDLYHDKARRCDRDGLTYIRGAFRKAPTLSGYVFEPNDDGEPTLVIPVFDSAGIIDLVAISGDVWGATTCRAAYLGTLSDPLRIHKTPASWLAGDDGVLVLSKSFLA